MEGVQKIAYSTSYLVATYVDAYEIATKTPIMKKRP